MFEKTAFLYDPIYSGFKDYDHEAAEILALVGELKPGAESLLDVACGTGEHMLRLHRDHGLEVDGIDLSPEFVAIARRKNPDALVSCADMATFELDRRYDVVISMFSSIGYILDEHRLAQTLLHMRDHLGEGGLLLVEPWFDPDGFEPGHCSIDGYEGDDFKAVRASNCRVDGHISTIEFQFLVARPDGIESFEEHHRLRLYTRDEMATAFEAAGLDVEYRTGGFMDRGLWIGRPKTEG